MWKFVLAASRSQLGGNASHRRTEMSAFQNMPTEQPKLKGGAERMRRYRERKRRGVICVASVPIYEEDIEALVARRRLKLEDKGKPGKVAAAVEYLVDDWTKGKLVPKGDAQQD